MTSEKSVHLLEQQVYLESAYRTDVVLVWDTDRWRFGPRPPR